MREAKNGFTVVELLIVVSLSLVVVGGTMVFIVLSVNQQNAVSSRAVAATQEQTGLQRLTRDLRQAVNGTTTFTWSSSSASATFQIATPGSGGSSSEPVAWRCSFGDSGACTRTVGSGSAVTEISNVESLTFTPMDSAGNALGGSAPPYSATDSSTDPIVFVKVTLQVLDVSQLDQASSPSHPAYGASHWITVTDGISLRDNAL